MSSSAISTQVAQLKIGNVQNQADTSAVYNGGIWSFKNSTALTSVTIDNSGNVGIGTTSPQYQMEIYKASDNPYLVFHRLSNGSGVGIGRIAWDGLNAASSRVEYGRVQTEIVTNTTGTHFGRMLFYTAVNGVQKTRAMLDDQQLRVFSAAAKNQTTTTFTLGTSQGDSSDFELVFQRGANGVGGYYNIQSVEQGVSYRDLHLQRNGGVVQVGNYGCVINPGGGDKLIVTANGANTSGGYFFYNSNNQYGTVSDKRVKENIEQLDKNMAIDFVRNLKPVSFNYKENEHAGKVCGFIAQDVLAVAQTEEYKNIVSKHKEYDETNPESPLIGISDHSMTPSIVATLQHLLSVVEAQAAEIAELKAKLP